MRSLLATFVLSLVLFYLAYNALAGDQGLAKWTSLQKQEIELSLELEALQAEKSVVLKKIQRLRPETLDLDYVEEIARQKLAYARKNEVILNVKE